MGGQPTLRSLLAWAGARMSEELPNLDASRELFDDGGAPEMDIRAQHYLNLAGKDERRDDWRRAACKRNEDGDLRTPLRCAIEGIHPPELRLLLRDVTANVLFPSDVAEAHGIPRWAAGPVLHYGLMVLRQRHYDLTHPVPERGWISGRSDAQRDAESAA